VPEEITMPALSTLPARRSLAGIAVVAALAVLAAGCGGDDDDGAATSDAPATTETMDDDAATSAEGGDDMAEDEADDMVDETTGDVLEVAAAEPDLGTFLDALEAAGTMDSLHGPGPFTVFAPTDEAFAAYLDESGMTQDQVFGDPEALRSVLEFHVVEMDESAEMVMEMAGQQLTTASGEMLDVAATGDDVMVGNAMIVRDDLEATNGVVHVIDHVLVPPSMAGG
jgi:uncharacterized surface protein with fasciclin (FAS1) repeats